MPERWIDKAYSHGSNEEERNASRAHYESTETREVFGVAELEKTEAERRGVEATIAAFNEMFAGLDLPDFAYSEDRIHIMDPEEFRGAMKAMPLDVEPAGMWVNGHVYVQRTADEGEMLFFLTHEVAHAASHYAVNVWHEQDEDGGSVRRLSGRKSGMKFMAASRGGDRVMFSGLNEAFTELVAHSIRGVVAQNYGLGDDDAEKLRGALSYLPQIIVLDGLERMVSGKEEWGEDEFKRLLTDYVSGKMRFLKEVERKKKGAVRILADMDATPASALATAEALGFDAEAEKIRKLIADDEGKTGSV